MEEEREKEKKAKVPELQIPMQRQRFITIENVTEYTHIYIHP